MQALHLCEFILPCRIYVTYIPRCSTPQAMLADKLSRYCSTTEVDLQQLRHLDIYQPHGPLVQWLRNPKPDWDLWRLLITCMSLCYFLFILLLFLFVGPNTLSLSLPTKLPLFFLASNLLTLSEPDPPQKGSGYYSFFSFMRYWPKTKY
jgi:hypothetical protein